MIPVRIWQAQWVREDVGDGSLEYHYHCPSAPHLQHESVPHPVPEYLRALIAEVESRHTPYYVTDGSRHVTALPRCRFLRLLSGVDILDQPAYQLIYNISWYGPDGQIIHAELHQEVLRSSHEAHRAHHAHRQHVERRIRVDLTGHHGLAEEG